MKSHETSIKHTKGFMGHPGGLGILASGNFFNSFAWGGVYAILIYYLYMPYTRGLAFTQGEAASMIAAMGACNAMFTIMGSWLADRVLGARKALIIGDIVKGIAFLLLALPVQSLAQGRMIAIISLILMALPIMGASNASLTGQLYRDKSNSLRDKAYTIHAIANQLGGFIAPILIGFIGVYSYPLGFFICSLFAFAYGGMIALFGKRYFHTLGAYPSRPIEKKMRNQYMCVACIFIMSVGILLVVGFQYKFIQVQHILYGISFLSFMIPILFLCQIRRNPALTTQEKGRLNPFYKLFTLQVLASLSSVFITTALAVFIQTKIELHIFGVTLAPSTFTSIFALMSMMASSFLIWCYSWKKNQTLCATKKYAYGLLMMAISYSVLCIPIFGSSSEKFSCVWLLVYYAFLAIAQNLIDPIGASLTAKIAPQSYETQLQSAWLQSNSIANGISILVFQFLNDAHRQMWLFPIMAVVLYIGCFTLCNMRKKMDPIVEGC